MKFVAVLGMGRFGSSVARTLADMGCQILAIDRHEDKIRDIEGVVTQAVQMDATDERALRAVGIKDVDAAVVAIGAGMEASILASLLLKEMGVPYVISKAVTATHGRVLEKIGCDRVVFPEIEMGVRVARRIVSPGVLDELGLEGDYGVFELKVPSRLSDKSIKDIGFRNSYGLTIIAIKSGDKEINIAPQPNDRLREGDVIVVIGSKERADQFNTKVQQK